MEFRCDEKESHGIYVTEVEGVEAELRFHVEDGRLVIEHVEVPGELSGRSVGTDLVRHAVEEARRRDLKISPVCGFAKAQLDKHSEWHDVLQ